jgi:hypothetical protein
VNVLSIDADVADDVDDVDDVDLAKTSLPTVYDAVAAEKEDINVVEGIKVIRETSRC